MNEHTDRPTHRPPTRTPDRPPAELPGPRPERGPAPRPDRRGFLRAAVLGATAATALGGSLWRGAAHAAPDPAAAELFPAGTRPAGPAAPGSPDPALREPADDGPAQPGPGPYGALATTADENGILLPVGFTSRVVARSGRAVASTSYIWHDAPDGGACYADGDGWIYVSNSEVDPSGGASAVRFSATGGITDAYRILSGTRQNCAGGRTPWDTWLSCEEVGRGYVYEADPWGVEPAVRRDAMGRFKHEAAAADPVRKAVYLTEDESDGCLYRFVPDTWGDLAAGTLQVLVAGSSSSGSFSWKDVPDPDGSPKVVRKQVSGAKKFSGGEGCHYADDRLWFTTKGDDRVWRLNLVENTYGLAYDDSLAGDDPPLTGADNLTGSASGDLFVAEDGGTMDVCVITPDGVVATFLRVEGQPDSEITGPAFSPDGGRLYFSSQRGTSGSDSGGITYEVSGPFRV